MSDRTVRAVLVWTFLFTATAAAMPQPATFRVVHVFVALADNEHQGIVPVAAKLGNGEDAEHNLYWGSAYGVKTFFSRSADWMRVMCGSRLKSEILERCIFKHRAQSAYLVADAYRGKEIRQAILDFLTSAAGDGAETITLPSSAAGATISARGGSNLVVYVGHDGLMDFQLSRLPPNQNKVRREAIVLACASKQYFFTVAASFWRVSHTADHRAHGARGLHTEKRVGRLDGR